MSAANQRHAVVTGSAGFFGRLLSNALLIRGWRVSGIDLQRDERTHPLFRSLQGDIRSAADLDAVFQGNRVDAVFHVAAILAHAARDQRFLWTSNVDGTARVAEAAVRHSVRAVVFTSSNCLWGNPLGRPVLEEDPPSPVEIYGRSKWEGEKILASYGDRFGAISIRCPTIIDAGRLGLLAILFEFIDEGRKVWVVGPGSNRYQFVYAADLIDACMRAVKDGRSNLYNIGTDRVQSLRESYEFVIARAGSGARVASLPQGPTLLAMRAAYALGLSPLGPYQYKMIAESFEFDTTRIRNQLGWRATLSNAEMLWRAYEYYSANRDEIEPRGGSASAHRSGAPMGVIRLLKWLS